VANFLGATDASLIAIGKVTVAAGGLEEIAREIDYALGGKPGKKQFKDVVREIRQLLADGLPAYVEVQASDVQGWTERAVSAMDDRDRWAHSGYKQIKRADAFEPIAQHLRSGVRSEIAETAGRHAERLRTLYVEGLKHHVALLPKYEGVPFRMLRPEELQHLPPTGEDEND
jgi:hypothetical protein